MCYLPHGAALKDTTATRLHQERPRRSATEKRSLLPTFAQTLDGLAQSMNVRPEKIMTVLLGLLAISGMDVRAQGDAGGEARDIKAIQEDEKTIRVMRDSKR